MSERRQKSMTSRDLCRDLTAPDGNQWIEIIEPKTKVQMFANLITGECRWDEPRGQGVVISRASNPALTQWWELYDSNSQRFYYYCAKDSKTVWKRPTTADAVVVPLAKLQILKQNTCSSHPSSTTLDDNTTTPKTTADVFTQTEPQLCSRSTQTTDSFQNNYCLNNSFRNPSLKHYLISEARLTHAMRADATQEYDSNDEDFEDVLNDSDVSCDADDEYDCDYSDDELSDDDQSGDELTTDGRRHQQYVERRDDDECNVVVVDVDDDIRRRRDDRTDGNKYRQQINSLFATQTTSPTHSPEHKSASGQTPTKSHSLTQIAVNSNNSRMNQKSETTKRLTTATTTQTTSTTGRPQTPPNCRQASRALSVAMTTASSERQSDQSLLSIESFAKENIERHRKRGMFGKKVSLKSMLEWSKKSIRKPMISSISDQKLRNESKMMFKCVQKFMRDVTDVPTPTTDDDMEMAFHLLTTAAQQPILRDELLVQISRQTTSNPSPDSELRGLRLMCCCFWYFPPSHKLAPHLNAFLSSHVNAFARDVVKRKFDQQLRRSKSSHVVYVRKPHDLEEVSRVLRAVHFGFCGVFGESLADALVDHRRIPWPIVSLTEALLRCRGGGGTDPSGNDCCEREGVFRCVGDLDDVMRLKVKMITREDINDSMDVNVDDIHVIASALKLYFRELKESVIPVSLYWEAVDSAHDPHRASALVERLPPLNRLALSYLIRFLQVFSAPEHVIYTKMDDANLSMVWAPNLLRNDDTAPNPASAHNPHHHDNSLSSIFERTRSEMSFVRTLIQNLDTGFMSGVQ